MVCGNVNEHLKKEVNEFAKNEMTRVIVPIFFFFFGKGYWSKRCSQV